MTLRLSAIWRFSQRPPSRRYGALVVTSILGPLPPSMLVHADSCASSATASCRAGTGGTFEHGGLRAQRIGIVVPTRTVLIAL